MYVAKTFSIWFQTLAPHGPDEDAHPYDLFRSELVKVDFKYLQAVAAKIVVILLFAPRFHLVQQLMYVAKTFSIWFQTLAPHGPDEDAHPYDLFRSELVKVDFKYLQYFHNETD